MLSTSTLAPICRRFRLEIDNGLPDADDYLLDGNGYRGRAERERRTISYSAELEWNDETYRDYVADGTDHVMTMSLVHPSGAASGQMVIAIPYARFQSAPITGGVGKLVTAHDIRPLQSGNQWPAVDIHIGPVSFTDIL